MQKSATSPADIAAQKNKTMAEEAQSREDLKHILAQPQGRRVLRRLMESCRATHSIFETSARMPYNSGRQDVGLEIFHMIQSVDQEALFAIMREAKQEEKGE